MLSLWCFVLPWDAWLLRSSTHHVVNPIQWMYRNLLVLFFMCVVVGIWVFVVALFVYHIFLLSTAQTTWEHLCRDKIDYLKSFPREVLPFSAGGALANAVMFFRRRCRPPPIIWRSTWKLGDEVPFN